MGIKQHWLCFSEIKWVISIGWVNLDDSVGRGTHWFFFLNNFIYKTITYTTYSINYTYIVLATYTTDTYTYTNYAYTTLRYMYYNTININLIYGWRVYKVLFN